MFLHGNWKNFDEMEEEISLPELKALLNAIREKERREQKFAAALKGVDLDEDQPKNDKFEEVKQRVNKRLKGEDDLGDLPGFIIKTE